ncbi:hypothetical protein DPMN_129642 [Dreissena polymorpha]|uniref:Uncharacterized protein n=1 Tax=Dreissena polymorpha TaxID=45954 RepID=A0A9D4H1J6_DREPO|nr:hypothetical protein DPMN_129642 [Dreissena polymorpha]
MKQQRNKTREEMLMASRERYAIQRDMSNNHEELVSLKTNEILNCSIVSGTFN